MSTLPLGKLPPDLLAKFIQHFPQTDPAVLLGPGIGLDCAVLDFGDRLLVFKSEPITFVTTEIGWYAVQIACNDIATTGAQPRWMLVTMLLPEGKTTPGLVEQIGKQLASACLELGITLIGGHSEITAGLDRPILNTTMIGEVKPDALITPRGAKPGDHLLLTQSIAIEGTAILAREFSKQLSGILSPEEIEMAQQYIYEPGISVVPAARAAVSTGHIHAMHDPTEGGLASALHEMAQAAGCAIVFQPEAVPIASLSRRICTHFNVNPLATIASGALLLAVPSEATDIVIDALTSSGTPCTQIGQFEAGDVHVWQQLGDTRLPLPLPARDEIARLFDETI